MFRGRLQTRLRTGSVPSGLGPELIGAYTIVAEQTGGLSAFFQFAERPLAALDRSTRFHYVLGYYPSEPLPPHEYRRIAVSVTRPGLKLLYRHGYVAEPSFERPEEYRRAVTEARLEMAGTLLVHPLPRRGPAGFKWEMRLSAPVWRSSTRGGQVLVTMSFDPQWVVFESDGAAYTSELDCLLLADDSNRNVIGQRRFKLDMSLTETDFRRTAREWLRHDATVEATARPTYLRAVLLDFKHDRTASTQLRVFR